MVVQIGKVKIGGPNFTVIAGPCSIESEQQLLTTAQAVKSSGAALLRGGIWKMRTSAAAFQGLGAEAFPLIKKIKELSKFFRFYYIQYSFFYNIS